MCLDSDEPTEDGIGGIKLNKDLKQKPTLLSHYLSYRKIRFCKHFLKRFHPVISGSRLLLKMRQAGNLKQLSFNYSVPEENIKMTLTEQTSIRR